MVRFSRVSTNGIELHIAESGASDGPLVFLLHGFPEFWYGWRNQITRLAEEGFHVIAPDQRGYNLSDKPKGINSYDLDHLGADIAGLADQFGQDTFSIAGHDWGASVGWWLAGQHPQRVRKLAALNAPHPAVWLEAMRNNPAQKRKSRYVRLFKLPYLPEFLLSFGNYKALATSLRSSMRAEAFSETELERYRNAWSQPGAITAMIHWYRALLRKSLMPAAEYRISCPTIVIWGLHDAYAEPELAEASVRLCPNGRVSYFDQSTHWVLHDEPDRAGSVLADFLRT
ncbi:MAG: alpha/beta fold hydrolase [Bryobacteraceae bacterium]